VEAYVIGHGLQHDHRGSLPRKSDEPEHHRSMRFVLPALGVVLVLVGAVWTLQGSNLLGGSFMSGSRLWLVIGLVALVAGIWLVVRAVRARRA
jgi:uncharacterized membrane protein HdeD (DUF308 family)